MKKARKLGHRVLFSLVEKTNMTDPLTFHDQGKRLFKGKRFFWQNQSNAFALSGWGIAEKIDVRRDALRFHELKEQWQNLARTAVLAGVSNVEGTGPLLFGGLSFAAESGENWKHFGGGQFYIPACMLTVRNGQAYITKNIFCYPDDRPNDLLARLNEGTSGIEQKFRKPQTDNPLIKIEEQDPNQWTECVQRAIRDIRTTELEKVVLARTLQLRYRDCLSTDQVLRRLREQQKGTFIFSLESGEACFLGATPERLVRKSGGKLLSACLAGSIRRGHNTVEDARLGQALLKDPKNRREHQYVVSLIKSVLDGQCRHLDVPSTPELIKNKHIQHLYTPVIGECDPDQSLFDFIEALHPTPALGGLPQKEAVNWICRHEQLDRGLYGAPIGWMDVNGNGEFAVGIRSALIQDCSAVLFAGCGILSESDPGKEYQETAMKFQPMMNALGGGRP